MDSEKDSSQLRQCPVKAFIGAMRQNTTTLIQAGESHLSSADTETSLRIISGVIELIRSDCAQKDRSIVPVENTLMSALCNHLRKLFIEGKIRAETRANLIVLMIPIAATPDSALESRLMADLRTCCRQIVSDRQLVDPASMERAERYGWNVHHRNGRSTIMRLDPDHSNRHIVLKPLFKNFIRELTAAEIAAARKIQEEKKRARRERDAQYRRDVRGHNAPAADSWGKKGKKSK